MKNLTRSECADILLAHDHYAIVTHRRPDGDTIGSSALLCMGLRQLGKNAPVGRLGQPEDVAKAMLYLAEAEFVTGQVLPVNGGFIIT